MYDLVIVGGGCAGLGSAIYANRFGMKAVIFSELLGGLITKTHLVENYPGFISLPGLELANHLIEHAKAVGSEIIQQKVKNISKEGNIFKIESGDQIYESKTILFATGTEHRKLGVPGEEEFANKGVSYCATCDAPFFKGKTVAIVGGSDSAIKESLVLAEHCKKVYIIYRGDKLRAEPINMKRMNSKNNIETIYGANVTEILGEQTVNKVKLDTGNELELEGLFVEIGGIPQTDLAKNLGVGLNEKGEIIIDKKSKTNIPAIYAAGDCTNTAWKQAIVGVAEGTYAAYSAFNYIQG